MEKLEERKIETIEKIHQFYCDECGKCLGESAECSDGYYDEIGRFGLNFYLADIWYKKESHFCDACREKFLKSIETMLKEKGFLTD